MQLQNNIWSLPIALLLLLVVSTTLIESHPINNNAKFTNVNGGMHSESSWNFLKELQTKPKENFFQEGITPLAFRPLDLGEIKPTGWLYEVLRTQAAGLSGHLDEIWPDIAWSQWLGGTMEGYERFPYFLDGVVPLAYLMADVEPIFVSKVEAWIDYILTHQQQPSGFLGPQPPNGNLGRGTYSSNDTWPPTILLKAFTQYYSATRDPRIITAMQKFFSFTEQLLQETPLTSWAQYRWQDLVLSTYWLYERSGDQKLLNLSQTLHDQGFNWVNYSYVFPCKVEYNEKTCGDLMQCHGVNNAMGVKAGAVYYRLSRNETDAQSVSTFMDNLLTYHGTAAGVAAADELLAGLMPSHGTETCATAEYMFSLEMAFSILGDPSLLDLLERIAFNAMPAQMSSDWWSHVYVQQPNMAISKFSVPNVYVNDGPGANMYGIAPNYGCCTANFNQAYPKLVENMWMKAENESMIVNLVWGPSLLITRLNQTRIQLNTTTNYPFESNITIAVNVVDDDIHVTAEFDLCLHIPSWAINASLSIYTSDHTLLFSASPMNGTIFCLSPQNQIAITYSRTPTYIHLILPMSLSLQYRYQNAATLTYGPLTLSLPIQEQWSGFEENAFLFEVMNTTAWNYALALDPSDLSSSISLSFHSLSSPSGDPKKCVFCQTFSPIVASVKAVRVPSWDLHANAAAPPPLSPLSLDDTDQDIVTLNLVPYANPKLRITEFPWVLYPPSSSSSR